MALSPDDQKNLEEIYNILASPAVASHSKGHERFDAVQFCLLFQKWPEEKRFPRKSTRVCSFSWNRIADQSVLDLARVLATVSPTFGATCTPDALLTACDWSLPYTASKVKDTNTLLALRAFANLFLSPAGRKNMQGMKVDEWLNALRKERSWEQVGARKLPYTTIALK